MPWPFLPLGGGNIDKTFFVFVWGVIIMFAMVAFGWLRRGWLAPCTSLFIPLALLLVAKLVTTLTSILPVKSFWGDYGVWSDSLLFYSLLAVLLLVILALDFRPAEIKRLIKLVIIQATILAIFVLAEAVRTGIFYQKVRPNSLLGNADFYLSYALLVFPVVVAALLRHHKNTKSAAMYGLMAFLLALSMFVTLPTHLQTIALPFFFKGKPDVSGIEDVNANIGLTNFTQTSQNTERFAEWKNGIIMGMQRPLIGTGPSTTRQAFYAFYDKLDLSQWNHKYQMSHPHNDVIEQFSQSGLLGLAAYLAFWIWLAVLLVRRRSKIQPDMQIYAAGVGAGLVLFLLFNLFLFTTVYAGILAWVWIGLLLLLTRAVNFSKPSVLKPAVVTALVGMTIVLVWSGRWYFAHQNRWLALIDTQQSAKSNPADKYTLLYAAAYRDRQAARLFPMEENFAWQASTSDVQLILGSQFSNLSDRHRLVEEANNFAADTRARNPYIPSFLITQGGLRYVLSDTGSSEEQMGIKLMEEGIAKAPLSHIYYSKAAEIAYGKHDLPLAAHFLEQGIAAVPQRDKQLLQSILDKLRPSNP